LEWAQVRALVADGISEREIARRLGMNRRTVARLARSAEPPRYRRAPTGSQLDSFEPVLRRLLEEWPQIKAPRLAEILRADYGYTGSLRLVQEHLKGRRSVRARLDADELALDLACCSSSAQSASRRPRSAPAQERLNHAHCGLVLLLCYCPRTTTASVADGLV